MTFIIKFVLETTVRAVIALCVTKICTKFFEWQREIFERIFRR